jgi:hypothetical protein
MVEIVSAAASSKLALRWLREGRVHIAGSHLEDLKDPNDASEVGPLPVCSETM